MYTNRRAKIQDRLVNTSKEITKKISLVENLWKKQRRRELVYLRRSELGARIFGKSQKRVLGKVKSVLGETNIVSRNQYEYMALGSIVGSEYYLYVLLLPPVTE